MKLYNLQGRLVYKNLSRYRVNWDKSCRSIVQFKVKKFFEPYWRNMAVYEESPVFGTLLKVDLLNLTHKIAIETNGKFHLSFNKFFHRNDRNNFLTTIKNDSKKAKWLEINGIRLIEIMEDEVDLLTEDFVAKKFDLILS